MFEDDEDAPHEGVIVTVRAFAKAIQATDDPPLLVLLNSCKSASQFDDLVAQVVPFAIGMADSIDDGDAINLRRPVLRRHRQRPVDQRLSFVGTGSARTRRTGRGRTSRYSTWAPDVDLTATILVKPTDAV